MHNEVWGCAEILPRYIYSRRLTLMKKRLEKIISKVESFRGTSLYASFLICTYALAKAASNSCIAFLIFQVLYTMPHATRLPRLGEEQYWLNFEPNDTVKVSL